MPPRGAPPTPLTRLALESPDEARRIVVDALRASDGNVTAAAKALGVSRRTLMRVGRLTFGEIKRGLNGKET